ncbi:MAG: hypothetical protein E6471_08860, partial [Bradyrhizobium sp.]|nr:hypothetical protein [Bradyrhizobium sp.]
MRLSAGSHARLGATWDGRGTNFALFSANAEKVELCLFDSQGRREIERIELPERTEDVWHGYLNDVSPGQLYGYRVYGPYEPERGHRFNANKLLLDPYAKRLAGRLVWSDAHFAYRAGSPREDLSFDRRDNARGMPKAVVIDETFNWGRREMRPQIPWEDTIIYEAHVKGLTNRRDDVPPNLRGTFGGLSAPAMIKHLKRLGVTTIELLPIHAFIDDLVSKHVPEHAYAEQWDVAGLKEELKRVLDIELPVDEWAKEEGIADEELLKRIETYADERMAAKVGQWGPDVMRYVEKTILLQTLDHLWREHLVMLDHLRQVIGLRGYGQRDPLQEYKSEAFTLFEAMIAHLREAVTAQLMRVEIVPPEEQQPVLPP